MSSRVRPIGRNVYNCTNCAVASRAVPIPGGGPCALALEDLDQLRERHLQPAGELHQHAECCVDLAALDRADVVAMQSGLEAQSSCESPRRARSSRTARPSAASSTCRSHTATADTAVSLARVCDGSAAATARAAPGRCWRDMEASSGLAAPREATTTAEGPAAAVPIARGAIRWTYGRCSGTIADASKLIPSVPGPGRWRAAGPLLSGVLPDARWFPHTRQGARPAFWPHDSSACGSISGSTCGSVCSSACGSVCGSTRLRPGAPKAPATPAIPAPRRSRHLYA